MIGPARLVVLAVSATTIVSTAPPPPRLTPDGWGALRIGMTGAQVTRAAGSDARPDAVGGPDPAQCDEYRPRRAPAGMIVMLQNGRLSRISVRRAGVRSDRGIAVGDTAQRVRAAYRGQRLTDAPHAYVGTPARYLTWTRPGAGAMRGIRYEIDARSRVSAIHAGGDSIRHVEGCL